MRWVVLLLAALFYLYEFVLRVTPSLLVDQLMSQFRIDAAGVGSLTAFYLYSYTPLQIPIGLLMDRIGARRALTFAAATCGLGTLLFGVADTFWVAALGRLLMGAGSAFAFVGLVFISARWFPPHWLATLVGIGGGVGFLGGLIADDTVSLAVSAIGWRNTSYLQGLCGLLLALLMFFTMRREMGNQGPRARDLFLGLRRVCGNLYSWLNASVASLAYATTSAFAGLWATSFMQQTYRLDAEQAGFIVSFLFLGWVVGSPIVGRLSDASGNRKPWIVFCSLGAALSLSLILYVPHRTFWALAAAFFSVGFLSSAQMLTFSLAIELNHGDANGTAASFNNFIVMLVGLILQPLVGWLLVLGWDGSVSGGVPIYSTLDYQSAMLLFPCTFVAAALLALLYPKRGPRAEAPSQR